MNARDITKETVGVRPLITAEEAFPLLERRVAAARRSVELSFRIFDTRTRLRTEEGLAAANGGEDWAALLAALAARGVRIRLLVADFDAIGGAELHRAAWASLRHLDAAAGRTPGASGRIEAIPALHSARVGGFWRQVFRGKVERELARLRAEYGDRIGEELPGLAPVLAGEEPQLHPATFHQKAAAVDCATSDGAGDAGEWPEEDAFALIGGLDVDERRWDTQEHDRPAAETWRDVTLAVTGARAHLVADAIRRVWTKARDDVERHPAQPSFAHLAEPAPAPDAAAEPVDGFEMRLTMSAAREGVFVFGPETTDDGNLRAAAEVIGEARRFLYIETQFLRSANVVKRLTEAAKSQPKLELVLILPFAPEQYAFERKRDAAIRHGEALQATALRRVRKAFGDRAAFLSPAKPSRRSPEDDFIAYGAGIVYVHSKVMIADNETALVGSANLNGRSLSWDTEISALWRDGPGVADFLQRLAASWLGEEAEGPFDRLAPWRDAAAENASRPPDLRDGFLLPHDERRVRRFGRRFPLVPDEMF